MFEMVTCFATMFGKLIKTKFSLQTWSNATYLA